MRPYDYAHRSGVHKVSWREFQRLCRHMARALAGFPVDVIAGLGRGGMIPAAEMALSLRIDLFPIPVSRRVGDRVASRHPVWRAPLPGGLGGRRVAVVDDMADTGETLSAAVTAIRDGGASFVVTAAVAAHTWAAPQPDVVGIRTDSLVVWPWGRYVLEGGAWVLHPEYVEAMRLQRQAARPDAGSREQQA